MEMCYDGALVMPSSYAVMNEDEMTYVDGGINKTYTGSQGWAVAAALMSAAAYLGSQLSGAGLQAAYNMRKKGKFTLKSTNNPFGLLSVS